MTSLVARAAALRAAVGATVLLGAWLFLAAMPALADGGPHVANINSGSTSLGADSCAGCHRAHTAQGELLINQPTEEGLCLGCHGAASTGATTDVMTGVQYALGADGLRNGATTLGALRSGGFDQARISSADPYRRAVTVSGSVFFLPKVSVQAVAEDVTSAHLNLPDNALTAPAVAWGNGAYYSPTTGANLSAGPTVNLGCGSCHNPHGNGQYRILNPVPNPTATSGTFVAVTAPGATVKDAALPGASDARNYTVIQVKGTQGTPSTYMLYASDVLDARLVSPTKTWPAGSYGATAGDYFHRRVPWGASTSGTYAQDAPNGIPANRPAAGEVGFNTEMNGWCTACHTRYLSSDALADTGDVHFRYLHSTETDRACTTCHVAHGSNAQMPDPYSRTMPFPDDTASTTGDSRLLKIDNRGTCQTCHDPTHTVVAGQNLPVGAPVPTVP